MTLTDLSPGETGIILNIEADTTLSNRLRELGLLDGIAVRMVKMAPLKGPVEIKVHHSYLTIRWDDAQTIRLQS